MNGLSSLAGQRGTEIAMVLAVLCALVAAGRVRLAAFRPALVVAAALGLLFWIAEGLGGIFTGKEQTRTPARSLSCSPPCFWPRSQPSATGNADFAEPKT